jgi:chromosome segregation ATPase
MPTMVREAWTDERLDDLANRIDKGFREAHADVNGLRSEVSAVREEIGELRVEIRSIRKEVDAKLQDLGNEVRTEIKGLRAEMNASLEGLNRTLQIGFWLLGTFLVGLMGLIAAALS